jgi:hypothetical protein
MDGQKDKQTDRQTDERTDIINSSRKEKKKKYTDLIKTNLTYPNLTNPTVKIPRL